MYNNQIQNDYSNTATDVNNSILSGGDYNHIQSIGEVENINQSPTKTDDDSLKNTK
jgi:hypothetical protein